MDYETGKHLERIDATLDEIIKILKDNKMLKEEEPEVIKQK